MDESVQVMKALWTSQERIDWEGKHYQLKGAHAYPKPYQESVAALLHRRESPTPRATSARGTPTATSFGATRPRRLPPR